MALKAFIGHSFTADDEGLVREFLKFFDQIKEMNIGFSWEHAESAEPKDLADKVLRLIEDKNLFIGICTIKEAAITPQKLSPTMWGKNLKASADYFEMKTSDWIIQETGLAIGRGMDLILLVENGVRRPGGLQGNKEYIPFDRNSPEKSFGKVLEMIQSLNSKAKLVTGVEAEIRTSPPETTKAEAGHEKDWLKPEPHWDRSDYEFALFHAILLEDKDSERAINKAYLEAEGRAVEKRESWEAYNELALLQLGRGGKLTRLDQMAEEHPASPEILQYRAKGYLKYGAQEKAAQYFETAAQIASGKLEKLNLYGDAALCFAKAGRKKDSNCIIEKMKLLPDSLESAELILLKTLRAIAKFEKSEEEFCSVTERILDLSPSDTDLRFDLAHKYSLLGSDDLALYHYLKIPSNERSGGTWNNLGVQFEHFDLMCKSVDAYHRAEKLGETLAMSNIAQRLIKAGFLREAEDICSRAVRIENHHKNVGYAISRIKDVPEAEERKADEILTNASPASAFLADYGYAFTKKTIGEHHGRWQGRECELAITIKGNTFLAEGTYEIAYSGLLALALSPPGASDSSKKQKYLIRYEGTIVGQAVNATFRRTTQEEQSKPRTILGGAESLDPGSSVRMILSDSFQEIRVYEKSEKEHKFYAFRRLD